MPRSISTESLLTAALFFAAAIPAGAQDLARARSLELEATLAKKPALYLYLDPAKPALEVRSRGLTLDAVPLQAVTVLHHHPLFGGGARRGLEVPGVWTVKEGPGDLSRETIAPDSLKPYVPEEERTEEPETPAASAASAANAKPVPEAPSRYLVPLENGWSLAVLDRVPRAGFFTRYVEAVRDGWSRLLGRPLSRPPLVALTMTAQDAERMHHLFRTDLAVLVVAGKE